MLLVYIFISRFRSLDDLFRMKDCSRKRGAHAVASPKLVIDQALDSISHKLCDLDIKTKQTKTRLCQLKRRADQGQRVQQRKIQTQVQKTSRKLADLMDIKFRVKYAQHQLQIPCTKQRPTSAQDRTRRASKPIAKFGPVFGKNSTLKRPKLQHAAVIRAIAESNHDSHINPKDLHRLMRNESCSS